MKKAFWICLVTYLVGVALISWLQHTSAFTHDQWDFTTNTWSKVSQPPPWATSLFDLRMILDVFGVIAMILGVGLSARWAFANANSMFDARLTNASKKRLVDETLISQHETPVQAGVPDRQLADGLTKLRSFALAIDKRLIAVPVAAAGAFFIASGFQSVGDNWAGQSCFRGPCFHPEWIAVGVGVVGLAVYLWKRSSAS